MERDLPAVTGFALLFLLMLLRVPIGFAMGIVGVWRLRGVGPYFVTEILRLAILCAVPWIALLLPNTMK